jgi:hypothetical protein
MINYKIGSPKEMGPRRKQCARVPIARSYIDLGFSRSRKSKFIQNNALNKAIDRNDR